MGEYKVDAVKPRSAEEMRKQKLQQPAEGYNAYYQRLKSGEGLFALIRSQGDNNTYDGGQNVGCVRG